MGRGGDPAGVDDLGNRAAAGPGLPAWHGGVDISLGTLQSLVEEMGRTLYKGQGKVLLLSSEGRVAGVEGFPVALGNLLGSRAGAGSRQVADQGDVVTRWSPDGALLQTFVPVSMRGTDRKWGTYIELPRAVVLASAPQLQGELEDQAQRSVATQLTIGGGISALALLCIWLMAQRIVAPSVPWWHASRTSPAGGDLTQRIDLRRDDEIGELAKVVQQLPGQTAIHHQPGDRHRCGHSGQCGPGGARGSPYQRRHAVPVSGGGSGGDRV